MGGLQHPEGVDAAPGPPPSRRHVSAAFRPLMGSLRLDTQTEARLQVTAGLESTNSRVILRSDACTRRLHETNNATQKKPPCDSGAYGSLENRTAYFRGPTCTASFF